MSRRIDAIEDAVAIGLRALPAWRGKANVALWWKRVRERRGPLDGDWHLRLSEGSDVCQPRGSNMAWSVAATGYWDRHIVELLAPYIEPGTVALDIGASLGLWTLPLARAAAFNRGRLWCFEPNPENLPWLEANIGRNELSSVVEVHAVALGSRRGTAQLGCREHGGGNGALLDAAAAETVEVPVIRLDDLDFQRRVSFVKMDVEGFELEVLRGARTLIERDRPSIFGEFNQAWLRMRGEDLAAELASITALGYGIFGVEERRSASWRPKDVAELRRIRPPFAMGAENLLLVPEARGGPSTVASKARVRSADHGQA
ncbi:MAG: FkbM family methyltransferase [Solirubrobacteraceae bacterium]